MPLIHDNSAVALSQDQPNGPGIRVTVAIPTVRHPKQLADAIASVRAQAEIDLASIEILVIDNAPEPSAAWVLQEFGGGLPLVRYVHEKASGPSHARNRAVKEAQGEFLVFLDDDETAAPDWLAALVGTLIASRADAVFGTVEPLFEEMPTRNRAMAERIYSRWIDAAPGAMINSVHSYLGTGNSAFRVGTCFASATPFPVSVAQAGGEDVIFLRGLVKSGRTLVWAPGARVSEHVPHDRVTFSSLRARRFRQGQLRTLTCLRAESFNPAAAAFWMAVGLVQAMLHGAQAGVWHFARNEDACETALIKMAGGLGKVNFRASSPTFYGSANASANELLKSPIA